MTQPKIGGWYAMCCVEDLYQIVDEEVLEYVEELLTDEEGAMPMVFDSIADAKAALWHESDNQERWAQLEQSR